MADITTELQYAADNIGSFVLPAGTSQVSSTIVLEGKIPFWLKGRATSVLEWTGATDSTMFDAVKDLGAGNYNFAKIFFHHVEAYSTVRGTSIFRAYDQRPHSMVMKDCTYTSTYQYPINIDECDYTVPMHFENMRTFGSGAARMRSTKGGVEGYWLTSLMEIKNWVHDGSERVGPAFDFVGVRGTKLMNIWDKGDPSLIPELVGNWAAPVSIRWNCIGHPSAIVNYIVEYDTDFTNAPGCYLHEFRTDSGYSVGKHEHLMVSGMTMHNYDIDSGVAHTRIMGGGGGAAHGLLVTFDACEDLDGDKFLVGGKALIRCENIWYNPGQEAKAASMQALVESMDTNTWSTPIMTATDRAPRETITTPLYEPGTTLYDARTDDVGDFETVLEGLP